MIKIGLQSLGCAKNRVDSEMILGMFPEDRFVLTNDPEEADLIIVNTCAFIESAKRESIEAIFTMANYGKKLVVVGCLAERYYEEIKDEIPEASAIIPIRDYDQLPQAIETLLGVEGIRKMDPLRRVLSTDPFSAYLRISDGCNNFCSFCAIPYIRGRFHSRPFEEILEEAKLLHSQGIKEISIISQDTTIYGCDFPGRRPNIVDLLKALEAVGFYSIRLLYLYPSEISDELIDLIAESKIIAHYFDIPVQCASDHLLKAMRRHSNQTDTMELFRKIKARCPDAILRSTLIAGFPGETEEDQKATLDFLEEVRFDHLGCFPYSREEGTAAYDLPDQVAEETKQARYEEIMKRQERIAYQQGKKQVGKVMEGIVLGYDPYKKMYRLRSQWNAPDEVDGEIYFTSVSPKSVGDIAAVRIDDYFRYDLYGEAVE